MPLSLLSSVEVGEVTEAWLGEACLLMLSPSPPTGGCIVEQGEVLLLARLEEGEILWGNEKRQFPHFLLYMCVSVTFTPAKEVMFASALARLSVCL